MGLVLAPFALVALFYFTTLGVPDLAGMTLRARDLPSDMRLQQHLTEDRGNCSGYGVETDPYFTRYNGVHCAKQVWTRGRALRGVYAGSPSEVGLDEIEVVYKVFETEHDASEYYWRFWGRHTHEPVPSYALTEVNDAGRPYVGSNSHALVWDPSITLQQTGVLPEGVPNRMAALYIFRTGRTLVKIAGTGGSDPASPYGFATFEPAVISRLAAAIHVRIYEHDAEPVLYSLRKYIDALLADLCLLPGYAGESIRAAMTPGAPVFMPTPTRPALAKKAAVEAVEQEDRALAAVADRIPVEEAMTGGHDATVTVTLANFRLNDSEHDLAAATASAAAAAAAAAAEQVAVVDDSNSSQLDAEGDVAMDDIFAEADDILEAMSSGQPSLLGGLALHLNTFAARLIMRDHTVVAPMGLSANEIDDISPAASLVILAFVLIWICVAVLIEGL
eukprot:UC1_evm1s1748